MLSMLQKQNKADRGVLFSGLSFKYGESIQFVFTFLRTFASIRSLVEYPAPARNFSLHLPKGLFMIRGYNIYNQTG